MFGLFDKTPAHPSAWESIESLSQLDEIVSRSYKKPVVIFKHSTRCSISSMAKSRLESAIDDSSPIIFYLDLIAHREISNAIASRFGVEHESPQVIVINNGQATFSTSHGSISMDVLKRNTQKN